MCREGGGKGSPGVITLMNPGPYWPLYLWGFHLGGSQTNRPLPRGSSSRPKVTRLVRYGPVRQKKNHHTEAEAPHRTLTMAVDALLLPRAVG